MNSYCGLLAAAMVGDTNQLCKSSTVNLDPTGSPRKYTNYYVYNAFDYNPPSSGPKHIFIFPMGRSKLCTECIVKSVPRYAWKLSQVLSNPHEMLTETPSPCSRRNPQLLEDPL